jgi:hypothetical protein
MAIYYRFQHEKPAAGEVVHCFKTLQGLRSFVSMVRQQDPDFRRMKFWEVNGTFVREDDGDAVVKVNSAKEISV